MPRNRIFSSSEFAGRATKRYDRMVKHARLPNTCAHMAGIEFLPDRHLDKELFSVLRTNNYIKKGLNVILIGATGCGKSYIACALATNACHEDYKVRYFHLHDFFSEMEAARVQGEYEDILDEYVNLPLVIFDDFLLLPLKPEEQRELFIFLRLRDESKKSTILCSQVAVKGWHVQIGNGGVAETVLDRLTENGEVIVIDGDDSMRKRHNRK